jgi:transcriptional regulator with PAS, ATPase and Fis domain
MHGRRLIVDYQDVRTISATDQSLLTMVRMRQFREDLYCRLHILNLHLPALRDHSDDIPVLTTQLLQAALWRLRSPLNAPAVIEGIEPPRVRQLNG